MSGVQGQNVQGVAYMEDMPNAVLVRICQTEELKCWNAPHLNTERSDIFLSNETNVYSPIQHFQIKICLTETKI